MGATKARTKGIYVLAQIPYSNGHFQYRRMRHQTDHCRSPTDQDLNDAILPPSAQIPAEWDVLFRGLFVTSRGSSSRRLGCAINDLGSQSPSFTHTEPSCQRGVYLPCLVHHSSPTRSWHAPSHSPHVHTPNDTRPTQPVPHPHHLPVTRRTSIPLRCRLFRDPHARVDP